jgi:hypothetical protein
MSIQLDALESLRVIRSLMERAHIYRAISAPAATIGGLFAVAAGGLGALSDSGGWMTHPVVFLVLWLVILGVTSAANFWLLSREAARRNQPTISEGMRMAMRTILPPVGVGGILGIGTLLWSGDMGMAATYWMLFYGLALLGTHSFSPRSLVWLGWGFIALGVALFAVLGSGCGDLQTFLRSGRGASLAMAASFGLLHLIYAGCVCMGSKPEIRTQQ